MYLVTLRIEALRDLSELPEQFEMLECKPDTGSAPATDRWNGSTKVTINYPEIPYTGNYQDAVDAALESHAGKSMTYAAVKELLDGLPGVGGSGSQVRAHMKNCGLISKA